MKAFAQLAEFLSWTRPADRSQRDADRCKRLVDEVRGVSHD